jgi:ketosteroid isomerase-like protein
MKLTVVRRGKTVMSESAPTSASASAVDVVLGMYDALRRQHLAAALRVLDPGVVVWQSETLPWGGTYRGHQGFADYSGSLVKHVEASLDIEAVLAADDAKVIVTGRSRGRAWSTGKRFDAPFVHIWSTAPGGLTRLDVHVDTAVILEALEA